MSKSEAIARWNLAAGLAGTALERRFWADDVRAPFILRGSLGGSVENAGAQPGASAVQHRGLLSENELRAIEREFAAGMTSVQVVDVFVRRGIRFSEATLRKYIQQGLLPRSRRIGRKGKHQGSLGLYPATAVRRVNSIKRLMGENYTIEDIQRQFLRFRDEIEALGRSIAVIFAGFGEVIAGPRFDARAKRELKREVGDAKKAADDLTKRIGQIERRIAEPHERPSGFGAPGGAEDLL